MQLEIERSDDRNTKTRRNLLENIVLASHIGLRKQFKEMEIIKLYQQLQYVETSLVNTKKRLTETKSEENLLKLQKDKLEGQTGLMNNIPMLRDYKMTEEHLKALFEKNEKVKKLLVGLSY